MRTCLSQFAVLSLAISFAGSAAYGQHSEVRAWWNIVHDGWTGDLTNAWMFFEVSEGQSVPPDPSREYSVTWGSGSVNVPIRPNGRYSYWSPSYQSEAELLNVWSTSETYAFAADGEMQGTAGPVSGSGFSTAIPQLQNASQLLSITPGDQIDLAALAWSSPFDTDRSTWLEINDALTGERIWNPTGPTGADGASVIFDSSVLQANTEYNLVLKYSSRFLSGFDGTVLGETGVISGFDRWSVYSFTTIPTPSTAVVCSMGALYFTRRRRR